MNKQVVLKSLCALVVLVTLFAMPAPVVAQRGGHGGGGGFHGGGGGFHGGGSGYGGYHGGGGYSQAYGGNHGGNYYGGHGVNYGHGGYYGGGHYYGHGGYYNSRYYGGRGYGWGGGYWGYPGYGWGWGFGISVSVGSYWPVYPYDDGYVYAPPYYPYVYPYPYYIPGNSPTNYPSSYAPSSNNGDDFASAQQASAPVQQRAPAPSGPKIQYASYAATSPSHSYAAPGQSSTANSVMRQPVRPEVQIVIRALRGMPPGARQRQVDSGRYSNLSEQELKFAMYAAALPPAGVQGPPR